MRDSAFYQEVFNDGALEERRASILEMLQARFAEQAANPFAALHGRIDNLDSLRRLNRSAIQCASVDEFRAALASA